MVQEFTKVADQSDDPLLNNPLSQASSNPWNAFYEDQELKSTIMLDIDRTYQDRELFQQKFVKDLMVNVLFVWAKNNPDLGYKQGLNELLAVLVFVAYGESVTDDVTDIDPRAAAYLKGFNDRAHLEADLYWVFANVLSRGQKDLFNPVVNKPAPKSKQEELFSWNADNDANDLVGKDKSQEQGVSAVLVRCHRIHHRYLQTVDKELYQHLERIEIEPQMHLLRWIRCVLNREFLLADAINLWDAIFSCASVPIENKNQQFTGRLDPEKEFLLLDFLCVAMLVFVRQFLLESDNTGCLMRLLKFPPVENITELVSMAVRYKDYILGGCNTAKPNLQPTSEVPDTPAPIQSAPSRPAQSQAPQPTPAAAPVVRDDPLSMNRPAAASSRKPILIKETKTLTTNESPPPKRVVESIPQMSSLTEVANMLEQQLQTNTVNKSKVQQAIEFLTRYSGGNIEVPAPKEEAKASLQVVEQNPLMRPL